MAIKSSDQISIVDVTDAYSVILSSESHTFKGGVLAALAGQTTTKVIAMRGAEQVNASVVLSEITKPSGVTVTSDNNTKEPTLTISVDATVTVGGIVKIPVYIGDIKITKEFTFAIAFKGDKGEDADPITIEEQSITYQGSSSGTTPPTESWKSSIDETTVPDKGYLWTKTYLKYSDGTETESYSVSYKAVDGIDATPLTITEKKVQYQKSSSATTQPTTWLDAPPAAEQGKYLWTRTYVKYSDNTTTEAFSVSYYANDGNDGYTPVKGKDYFDGDDAITISIISSNGTIFKNTEIATTLTAHVYQGGVEITGNALAALGTLKWYKNGETTASATGQSIEIDAGDVENKVTYIVQLEG